MIWAQVIWFIVTLIVSIALSPKPPKPRAAALEDFDVPVAEENRPVPVVFGKKEITGANVLWYGNLRSKAIKKRSGFSKATVGYKYYMGFHIGLCHGPVDAIRQIRAAEKVAWTGNATASGTITISKGDLFGGEKREGGLQGVVDICMGDQAQGVNAYLDSKITGDVPAFRGIVGLVYRAATDSGLLGTGGGGYVGTTPYLKPWGVLVERYQQGWFNGVCWYPAKVKVGEVGMNPAHIIYQAITDTRFGMGSPVAQIDNDNFEDVADYLYDEGFGLNMLWNQSAPIEDFIGIVLDHIGGILVFDRLTNKYQIKLIRGDYNVASLATLTKQHIKYISNFQRRSWGETVNEVSLVYTDPKTQKDTAVTLQDLGNINAQQAKITERVSLVGISDHALAVKVCGRELAARCVPLARITFTGDRTVWPYKQGSVVKITWPEHNLDQTVFRILNVKGGTLEDGEITIEAVEDIYALDGLEYVQVDDPAIDEDPPETPPDDDQNSNAVISVTTSVPPSTPADGDRYVVPNGATGAWAGHTGQLAEWDADENNGAGGWVFTDIPGGHIVYVEDTENYVSVVDGSVQVAPWQDILVTAAQVSYDDSLTGFGVDNVQDAIVSVASALGGDRIGVRAFANGKFYGQTQGLDFYDSLNGVDWTPRATMGQTSLKSMLYYNSRYYGIAGGQIGKSNTSDPYGLWTYKSLDNFPLHGVGGGLWWVALRLIDTTIYTWATFGPPAGVIFFKSTDEAANWTEIAPNNLPIRFNGKDLLWDGGRFLFIGEEAIQVGNNSLGQPIYNYKPQVWHSTDLITFTKLADMHPTPVSASAWITQVAVRNINVPPQYMYLLRPLRARDPLNSGPFTQALRSHQIPELGTDNYIIAAELGSVGQLQRIDVYGNRLNIVALKADLTKIYHVKIHGGFAYACGRHVGGNTWLFRVSLATFTKTHERELFNGEACFHFGIMNNELCYVDDSSRLHRHSLATLQENSQVSLSPTGPSRDDDGTYLFCGPQVFDPVTATTVRTVTITPADQAQNVREYRVVGDWLFIYTNQDGIIRRYNHVTNTRDNVLEIDVWDATNWEPMMSKDGMYLGFGNGIAAGVMDVGNNIVHRSPLIVASMRDFTVAGSDQARVAYSQDGGVTWGWPGVTFPNTVPQIGATSIVWDGEKFVLSSRGWSGISQTGDTWTFSDNSSGLPETSLMSLFTNSLGRVAAFLTSARGVDGTAGTDDGLHWDLSPEIKVRAEEVLYDDTSTLMGAVTVQDALEILHANQGVTQVRSAVWVRGGGEAIELPALDIPVYFPSACTIIGWVILTRGGPGSCEVDIWKRPRISFPPTIADTICGGNEPAIVTAHSAENFVLTGWDVDIDAGDVLMFSLLSSTDFEYIGVQLIVEEV